MKVKRYVGQTNQEAIKKVKEDLGKEAVILHTRKIRKKGLLGWFSKPLVEVVAAVDDVIYTNRNSNDERNIVTSRYNIKDIHSKNNLTMLENLEKKVIAVEKMVKNLANEIYNVHLDHKNSVEPRYLPYYEQLVKNEVQEDIARELIARARELEEESRNFSDCLEHVILECLGKPQPLVVPPGHRKIAIFLGPTGVGKTTTLAKLAAIFSIQHQRRVGLITADTYRIAAVDQLKIYAEILGLPLSIVYSPKEIVEALKQQIDKEIILIDTAGKSLKDKEQQNEIKQLISYSRAHEVYLAISSNTTYQGCVNIINSYDFIPEYKFIFTKMDEATSYGIILNCCFLTGKPLSYITTGQNVPDDIEVADSEKIKDLLMGRE